jgi:sugar lactone lactonase YvrE
LPGGSQSPVEEAEIVSDCGLQVAVGSRACLGEGPSWDAREGVLWWVDIEANLVHRYDPLRRSDDSIDVGQAVGAVVPREKGGLVVALRDGVAFLDPISQQVELFGPVERERQENRMNDAKCDSAGRLWAGTMADSEAPGAGALYRIDADYTISTALDGVTISNGLGWSPDDRYMYYIDTGTQQVDLFDYDITSGRATGRRTFVEIPVEFGMPDGLAVDAEGFVWVAMWQGSSVRRYSPEGTLEYVLQVPASQVTSCAFGGLDLGDLYITTATTGLSDSELRGEASGGALFCCRPGVSGLPTNSFGG